jgi:septal ring factor EnvC (AmiA/AmiB activator)
MKWILGAILAAVIAWYFANETLQYLGLAIVQNDEWKIMATGWHILAKMWPVIVIILLGAGIVIALVLLFFSASEQKQKDEFEKRLSEAKSNDMELLNKLHRDLALEKQTLSNALKQTKRAKAENEKLISKINHQHSTIQRLHKKIDTLKSSF